MQQAMVQHLRPDMVLYRFPPNDGDFATCILALHDRDRVLLVDSGYEHHIRALADGPVGLAQIDSVVLSHEHEDHAFGCREIPSCRVIAATGFPRDVIGNRGIEAVGTGSTLRFGSFRLEFFNTPGHSDHHLVTRIDGSVVHVGDLLVETADGRPTPPYLAGTEPLESHMESLELVQSLNPQILVGGHGPVLTGAKVIAEAVKARLIYLDCLRQLRSPSSLADCIGSAAANWSRPDFHDRNLELMGLGGS